MSAEPLSDEELDTVRGCLNDPRYHWQSDDVEALFATLDDVLDRWAAEGEQWQTTDEHTLARALSAEAENSRLSQELKAAREETVPLLSHNAWLRERLPEWAERTHAAEAEVSRLRAALKDLQAGTPTSSTGLHALIAAALTEPEETNG